MNGIFRMTKGKRYLSSATPVDTAQYDAIVVGGGTAGAVAAITLAQEEKNVLIIERMNCLGGMGTAGHIEGYYYGNHGGLYEELDAESKSYEPLGFATSGPNGYNGELKKRVLENNVWKYGGDIHYHADLTGVLMEDNRVIGVEYFDGVTLQCAKAKIVIDATAEGYVCLLAGAEYTMGRELDGKVQPFGNVRIDFDQKNQSNTHNYTDCGYVSPVDPKQYSEAVLSAARFSMYLREDYREGNRLLGMTPNVGMREGALVQGEYRLTLDDVISGKVSKDRLLFIAYSNADNHGKDMAFENQPQKDWMIACSLWGLNFSVPVPMGCVIPKGIDGLLMAGRLISVDHDLASCVRMERDVQKCGEAVGLLASAAIDEGCAVREIHYPALEKKLRRHGCLLDSNDCGFIDSRVPQNRGRVCFPETLDEMKAGLASAEPGMAQWAVKNMTHADAVYPWLEENAPHLALHTAMALALRGDDRGAELMLQAVRRQDDFIPSTGRKFNMIRGAACLYLLGRLAYLPALDTVLSLITGWESVRPEHFQKDEFLADEEEYRFQYLSQAIVCAMAIAQRYPQTRQRVDKTIHDVIDQPDFSVFSTLKGAMQLKYQMAPMLRRAVDCLEARRSCESG